MKNGAVLKYQEPPEAKKISRDGDTRTRNRLIRFNWSHKVPFLWEEMNWYILAILNLTIDCGYPCHVYFMFKATYCNNFAR
jgi:hypothetical protein